MAKANAWTRDTLTAIGLENAHLEDWGEFGMGWQQINTWARMVSPDPEPLWMQAAPWSPATKGPVSGEVVYVPLTDAKELDELKGKLAGKIVLLGAMRPTPDITEPLFTRYTDEELKEMETLRGRRAAFSLQQPGLPQLMCASACSRLQLRKQALKMMADEGVLAIITPSRDGGDGGGTGIIFDDNGANLARDAQKRENAVTIPNARDDDRALQPAGADGAAPCAGDGGGEHRDEVHGRPRAWLRYGGGDSRHRSEAEGPGGDGGRASG